MFSLPASKALKGNINLNDLSKAPTSYEDFINDNMMKSVQNHLNSDCDNKNFEQSKSDIKINESGSEDESEIDLTTTSSQNDFVLVNGCIDFSNNNNTNSGDK